MAPVKRSSKSKLERAKQWLKGGGVARDDSDDELGVVDLPWEWIYAAQDRHDGQRGKTAIKSPSEADGGRKPGRKRKAAEISDGDPAIVGARMGKFECRIGDAVLLKADGDQAWVGLVSDLFDHVEEEEKMATIMWFCSPKEIRNKAKRRSDAVENELYITHSFDDNPLSSINGTAYVMSQQEFARRFPKGVVPRNRKEYQKIFICRRGCNTRTATYTNDFVWEDVYQGTQDLPELIELVRSQTRATRKASGPARPKAREDADLVDFVVDEDEDWGDSPRTPRKRRKVNVSTPSSKHRSDLTPRKLVTPAHKRIFVKKALEFTPLGTRVLSPHALSSPYQLARNQLHVSSVPTSLPCREEEFAEVSAQLEKAITDGTGSCIYIAGTPGTGKTATVREVVAQLNAAVLAEELDDFIFVEINGMKVTDPHQSYSLLWEALQGDRVSPTHALELLEREFSRPSPRRVPCVVLMDELDQLVTKNQAVMYNFFNWPQLRHSRLIVLAVANTMDLPERTLSNKISSRLGLHRITFKGYTHAQLIQIIESRLSNVPGNIVHPDAIQFASRKVAAVSGDARRALDICRRAVEIAEAEYLAREDGAAQESESAVPAPAPGTPSKTGRGRRALAAAAEPVAGGADAGAGAAKTKNQHIVTIATVKQAINEATSSPLQQCLRSLPLASKVFLAALLARVRRTGVAEALVGDVLDEARSLGLMCALAPVHDILLLEARDDVGGGNDDDDDDEVEAAAATAAGPLARKQLVKAKGAAAAPRVVGMEGAAVGLAEAGIIGVEARRGERVRRVRLGVGDEEVRLALRDDDEVRGLGFNA